MIARVLILILSFRILIDRLLCDYQNLAYASFSKMSEVYLEPAQGFKIVLYTEKVSSIRLSFGEGGGGAKGSILNVWLDSKHVICSRYFQKE